MVVLQTDNSILHERLQKRWALTGALMTLPRTYADTRRRNPVFSAAGWRPVRGAIRISVNT